MSSEDFQAVWLTLKLAAVVTIILLLIGAPLAWWLSQTKSRWKGVISTLVAMPMVLPPTVIGFYLLLLMGPHGVVGQLTKSLGLGLLPFSFSGLVVASVICGMPFIIQPLQNSFESVGQHLLEAAAILGASPFKCFCSIALPLTRNGFITAAILAFAHTIGEFGVVLMLGGNIEGETRVLSIQLYNHVEAMQYTQAHILAMGMMIFSFLIMLSLYVLRKQGVRFV
jgi:molybdate transport system permease protein